MKVAIIGCGAAGLSCIKQCLDENVECIAYEQGNKVGGTWNYYEYIDEADVLSQHSSMYKGLVTNLPKELMELDGLRHKEQETSFITQSEVIEYIQNYEKQFQLTEHIKFNHKVEFVDPIEDEKWIVKARDLKTDNLITGIFDGVIVCNGHYFNPLYPSLEGMDNFKGRHTHSHYIKNPTNDFKNKKVLIVGGGPSGVDIARMVSQTSDKVYFSFRENEAFKRDPTTDRSIIKPAVSLIKENSVVFTDGTEEEIEDIIYCTGYRTTFPFLSENCKIQVDENWVFPLFKHIINIEHPTMAIISVVLKVSPFPLFAIQARFFLAFLKGQCKVSKQEMYDDLVKDRKARDEKGLPKTKAHELGPLQLEYCEELTSVAPIRGLPPVIGLMFKNHTSTGGKICNYRVLNDQEFEVFPINPST